MADKRTEDLVKLVQGRQGQLESNRSTWEAEWQEVADFVIPIREDIRGNKTSGARQATKIFDGTAVSAAVLATDGIHGYHVSPAFTWFKYAMARKELNELEAIRQWLEDVEYIMYSELNASNFYDEMWPFIYDGLTIGTADFYGEEDITENKLVFECCHPGECYIAENRFGEIDVLHRKRKLTARKAVQMFGESNVPQAVKNSWRESPFIETEYVHAVFPREDWDARKKGSKFKRYASIWIQGSHLCKESGYDMFPYSVWRYSKSGKEAYGRSPATMALSDIKGLNLMSKTLLGAAQMAIDPPLNVPSDMQGKVQWKPRGKNYYDDPNRIISPIDIRSNFPVAVDREERKSRMIKEYFHVDFFLMLAQLEGRGNRTAYEVSKLQEEKAAVLGAELAPLNRQLDKILDYVFHLLSKSGKIPPPPPELQQFAGERFDPVYMGPLAQAQRRMFGTQGIMQGLANVQPLLTVYPEAADLIDFDETTKQILINSGFPQSAMAKEDKIKATREGRKQAQMAQMAQEQMGGMADGVKKLASADKDLAGGGPMSQLIQDLGGMNAPA